MFGKGANELICILWGLSKLCDSCLDLENFEFGQANVVFNVKFDTRRAMRSSIRVR